MADKEGDADLAGRPESESCQTPRVENAADLRAWALAETRREIPLSPGEAAVTLRGGEPRTEVRTWVRSPLRVGT